jgi:hypothetical protein
MDRRGIGEFHLNLGLTGIGQRVGTSDTEWRTGCKITRVCRTMSGRGPQDVQPHLSSQDQRDKRQLGSAKGFLHSGFGQQWPESQRRCAKAGKGSVIVTIESNNSNLGPLRSFSLRHPAVKSFLAKFGNVHTMQSYYILILWHYSYMSIPNTA